MFKDKVFPQQTQMSKRLHEYRKETYQRRTFITYVDSISEYHALYLQDV